MAGAQLLRLFGPQDVICRQRGTNHFAAMPVDDNQLLRRQQARCVDNVLGQRLAGDRVQYLGKVGVHALALAGSENDDVHVGRDLMRLGKPHFHMISHACRR
jgi:hypothetical protein